MNRIISPLCGLIENGLCFSIIITSLRDLKMNVKTIEEEKQLVNANKCLVEIFEQKIKTKISEVWGVKEEVN